jgi:hypothetical protein
MWLGLLIVAIIISFILSARFKQPPAIMWAYPIVIFFVGALFSVEVAGSILLIQLAAGEMRPSLEPEHPPVQLGAVKLYKDEP